MAPSSAHLEKLITNPSLGATTYQACALVKELERINEQEYLLEACKIRDVFLCIVDYVVTELWDLQKTAEGLPDPPVSIMARVWALGKVLHEIHAYIRYLLASSPRQSPPGIQVALNELTKKHLPKGNGEPVCLVRPQWKYNLTYVPLSLYLKELLKPSVLDPTKKLGANSWREMLQRLWERNPRKKKCDSAPLQLAILSFAGLDTHDTLLYPLLAHELGHFIDFSHDPQLYLRPDLKQKAEIRQDQVIQVLQTTSGSVPDAKAVSTCLSSLVNQVYVAMREIIADLLATRMLGFAEFIAQAEFLKTLAPWPQHVIEPTGYPGIRFRLQTIFEHLEKWLPNDYVSFVRSHAVSNPQIANPLLEFMEKWRARLTLTTIIPPSLPVPQAQLAALVENAVRAVLPELHRLAKETIPDDRAAQLTPQFFDQIERLRHDLPPSCTQESPNSFAEILSAGWAYQMIYGEARESQHINAEQQFAEYKKTCRLVLKAIELNSSPGTVSSVSLSSFPKVSDVAMEKGGVLGAPHIAARLQLAPSHPRYLGVTPLDPGAIKAASLDLRLGHWFVVAQRSRLTSVKLHNPEDRKLLMDVARQEIFVQPDSTFVIHPGDFVLGATLEFIALPADVMAFVEGKSSLGRLGLIVATATQVAPGFHGVIVLEMVNTGTVPLELRPQMEIAQLVLHGLAEPVPQDQLYSSKTGKYYCQVHP
jgi:dCTP deaminase